VPRKKRLELLLTCWKALPAFSRLRLVTSFERGKLQILELRASPAEIFNKDWVENEPAIGIALRSVVIAPPAFEEAHVGIAAVGLHALARRYQRGTDRAVLFDLLGLATRVPQIVRTDGEYTIETQDGGGWVGSFDAQRDNTLVVSTYLSDQQLQSKAHRQRR
jgi:hypothetical protein